MKTYFSHNLPFSSYYRRIFKKLDEQKAYEEALTQNTQELPDIGKLQRLKKAQVLRTNIKLFCAGILVDWGFSAFAQKSPRFFEYALIAIPLMLIAVIAFLLSRLDFEKYKGYATLLTLIALVLASLWFALRWGNEVFYTNGFLVVIIIGSVISSQRTGFALTVFFGLFMTILSLAQYAFQTYLPASAVSNDKAIQVNVVSFLTTALFIFWLFPKMYNSQNALLREQNQQLQKALIELRTKREEDKIRDALFQKKLIWTKQAERERLSQELHNDAQLSITLAIQSAERVFWEVYLAYLARSWSDLEDILYFWSYRQVEKEQKPNSERESFPNQLAENISKIQLKLRYISNDLIDKGLEKNLIKVIETVLLRFEDTFDFTDNEVKSQLNLDITQISDVNLLDRVITDFGRLTDDGLDTVTVNSFKRFIREYVKETVYNALKHARPPHITVRFSFQATNSNTESNKNNACLLSEDKSKDYNLADRNTYTFSVVVENNGELIRLDKSGIVVDEHGQILKVEQDNTDTHLGLNFLLAEATRFGGTLVVKVTSTHTKFAANFLLYSSKEVN